MLLFLGSKGSEWTKLKDGHKTNLFQLHDFLTTPTTHPSHLLSVSQEKDSAHAKPPEHGVITAAHHFTLLKQCQSMLSIHYVQRNPPPPVSKMISSVSWNGQTEAVWRFYFFWLCALTSHQLKSKQALKQDHHRLSDILPHRSRLRALRSSAGHARQGDSQWWTSTMKIRCESMQKPEFVSISRILYMMYRKCILFFSFYTPFSVTLRCRVASVRQIEDAWEIHCAPIPVTRSCEESFGFF